MTKSRSLFAALLVVAAPEGALAERQRAVTPADAALVARCDQALGRAARFLVAAQSADGAWRSEVYGFSRDGASLTPHVLSTLYFLEQGGRAQERSFRAGSEWLAALVEADGKLQAQLEFPVYTSAAASWVAELAGHEKAQRAWLDHLLARQLGTELGWSPSDSDFGGWGYSLELPRKPAPGDPRPPLLESNLSATCFAIGALRTARVPRGHDAWAGALAFTQRCQNWPEEGATPDPGFDDGGFIHAPGDAARNKAGAVGVDAAGRKRFHSYGSMTADGVRVLIQCGLPPDHPRVAAARSWLETHFRADANPGTFEPDREVLRTSTYYYWCWSVTHAFRRLGVRDTTTSRGRARWAEEMAEALLSRQQPDGSWRNAATASQEDDPLVATPFAAAALELSRRELAR